MLNELIILGGFTTMALTAGVIYQLVRPIKSTSDELATIGWGFAGGIVGIAIASYLIQTFL